MNNIELELAIAIELARKTTYLDNIKIIPVGYETGIRHTTKTLNFLNNENIKDRNTVSLKKLAFDTI